MMEVQLSFVYADLPRREGTRMDEQLIDGREPLTGDGCVGLVFADCNFSSSSMVLPRARSELTPFEKAVLWSFFEWLSCLHETGSTGSN